MKYSTMIAALSVLALTGCDQAKSSFDEGFEKGFTEKFVESCVGSATKNGVAEARARQLCTCAVEKVNERFSVKEKMSLKTEQMMPIVEECKAALPG